VPAPEKQLWRNSFITTPHRKTLDQGSAGMIEERVNRSQPGCDGDQTLKAIYSRWRRR